VNRRLVRWLSGLILVPAICTANPASWSAHAKPVNVATPQRYFLSTPLQAPGNRTPSREYYDSVRWRFESPTGVQPEAWLCLARGCDKLPSVTWRTIAFRGRRIREPLYFRFRLPRGAKQPVVVSGLQVLVNIR